MQLSFALLLSALVVCFVGRVAAVPMIVSDLQSGQNYTLPLGLPGTLYDAQYDTGSYTYQKYSNNPSELLSGSYPMVGTDILIDVIWAGDFQDSYSLEIPAGLTVALAMQSDPTLCNITSQTVLTSTDGQCVYNLSWTAPFVGTFAIVYANSTAAHGSETVALTFVNPAVITGDPQFVGLRGQSYQVHGLDGGVYALISETNTQINSRFVFLTEGSCPTQAPTACWSHPGSYMGDMSFQSVVDGKLHAALVTSGAASKGFSNVQMDGKALKVGDTVSFGAFSISFESTHSVTVSVDNFSLQLSNSDMFLNMALSTKVALSQLTSHGLIGQTHANKVYKSAIRYIEGEVDDYLISDNDVFGTDFPFNRFNQ